MGKGGAVGHHARLASLAQEKPGRGRGRHARGVREAQAARRAARGVDLARQEPGGWTGRGPDNLPFRPAPGLRRRVLLELVYAWFQERQPVVEDESFEVGVELARRDGGAGEGGQGFLTLIPLAWLVQGDPDALFVDLDDVVRRRHRAAHAHGRYVFF